MNAGRPGSEPCDEVGLLRQAISYALAVVGAVTPELLGRPTPCPAWDLNMLLWHANESLAALHEGASIGCVAPHGSGADGGPAADPAQVFRDRAPRLLDSCGAPGSHQVIAIADRLLTLRLLAGAGALEIAVHGWDISRACGDARPIPRPLAVRLLMIAPPLVPETGRHPLFAAPVPVPATASPSDRLAGFLGRQPAGRPADRAADQPGLG